MSSTFRFRAFGFLVASRHQVYYCAKNLSPVNSLPHAARARLLQMLPGHERTKIDEPMDTIFVKQVRANSPAAEAGLRTGDRVVSVDGTPTRGEQYASVVQRIQQAGPWLRLLVVSKEDDILQRVTRNICICARSSSSERTRVLGEERGSSKREI